MTDDITIILDKCLDRIRRGETAEQCLADYPALRAELEPLLGAFQKMAVVRRVAPSAQFKQKAYSHLMSQIRAESRQSERSLKNGSSFSRLRQALSFKTLVPAAMVVLIALFVWIALPLFSPAQLAADEFTLSILDGNAEINRTGSSAWLAGNDGMHLKAGSKIRTPDNSFALLTFFDSSTIKLEPGTEVLVSRSEYIDHRSTIIQLQQQTGITWSYIAKGGGEETHFTLHTPQGYAVAKGTAFSTEVGKDGKTRFTVAEGSIQVVEGNQEVRVEADKRIEVADKMALAEPLPVPPSENELVISTTMPGIGSVRDPNGASTGHFPDGLAFNQITNSKTVLSTAGQQIMIGEPVAGEYIMAVRKTSDEDIPVNIEAKQNGKVVFRYSETLHGSTEKGWIIRIKLDTGGQTAVSANVVSTEPFTGKAPENVIETDLAKKRAIPITNTGSQDNMIASKPAAVPSPEETKASSTPIQTEQPSESPSSTPPVTPAGHGTAAATPAATSAPAPKPAAPSETPNSPGTTPALPRDTTAPVVVSASPRRNAKEVKVDEVLTATFSEGMDAASINENSFTLLNGDKPVGGLVTYDTRAKTAALIPNDNLEANTTYTAIITGEAVDQAGNGLSGSYTWGFTTGSAGIAATDKTPPAVISVTPNINAGDTAVNAGIEVVFDEAISAATILDVNNFSLTTGSTSVACEAVYSSSAKTATFTPDESLQYDTTYTATITTGVTDLAGNRLASNYTWSFSTGVPSQVVILSVEAPATAAAGSTLEVDIKVSEVTDLSAFEFDLSYDKTVIQITGEDSAITQGKIGPNELVYDDLVWSFVRGNEGRLRFLGVIDGPAISGSGSIIRIHFKVIGETGRSSLLSLSKMKKGQHTEDLLFDSQGKTIAANVTGDTITVSP
jgi:hypothetical protein